MKFINFNNSDAEYNLETPVAFAALLRFDLPDSKETAVNYIDEGSNEFVIE